MPDKNPRPTAARAIAATWARRNRSTTPVSTKGAATAPAATRRAHRTFTTAPGPGSRPDLPAARQPLRHDHQDEDGHGEGDRVDQPRGQVPGHDQQHSFQDPHEEPPQERPAAAPQAADHRGNEALEREQEPE